MVNFCYWKLQLGWLKQFPVVCYFVGMAIAWENSPHFATPALISLRIDVETSAEIPYWWRVTTQIWLVLLVVSRGKFASANHMHLPDLGSDASSVWNFCARFSDVISRGNQWWRCEMLVVFSGWDGNKKITKNILWLVIPDWIKFVWYLLHNSTVASCVWWKRH